MDIGSKEFTGYIIKTVLIFGAVTLYFIYFGEDTIDMMTECFEIYDKLFKRFYYG